MEADEQVEGEVVTPTPPAPAPTPTPAPEPTPVPEPEEPNEELREQRGTRVTGQAQPPEIQTRNDQ